MTSEIAVMNQRAVAMAADSAVTLTDGRKVVVRNEQRKLFQLVEKRPVGIMIFGVAEIMGHPWDHLFEHYSDRNGGATPAHLRDYGANFTATLDNLTEFFSPDHYRDEYRRLFASVCAVILGHAKTLQQYDDTRDDLTILEDAIGYIWRDYQMRPDGTPRPDLACFPPGFAATIGRDYGDVIDELIGYWFVGIGIGQSALQQLRDIAAWCVVKELFLEDVTGLVFAGFGSQDRYPAQSTWYVSAIISGIAKRAEVSHDAISNENRATIRTFADSAVTRAFILGIDGNLERFLHAMLGHIMRAVVGEVVDAFPEADVATRQRVRNEYQDAVPAYLALLREITADFQQEAFIDPLLTVLSIATRADLAQTARELVSLNAFKKRIMAQHETVGGEIDVAVISRDGGFQWWPKGS